MKVDGEQYLLEEAPTLDKKFKHTIEVVVDRLVMKDDLRTRLTQSVETAVAVAEGLVTVDLVDTDEERTYSEKFACPEHGVSLPELQPRIFSFNSPHGACPRCTGLGAQQEIDPDLLVPDPTLSIDDGALVPWAVGNSGFYESVITAVAERYEIPTDVAWQDLERKQQDYFLYGTSGDKVYVTYRNRMGRRRSYMLTFEGIVASLQRRYRETDSSTQRERIEEYMSFRPCPVCKGARLKPEVLAVTVGGLNIHDFTRMSVARALRFVDALELTPTEELIGHRIIKEIRSGSRSSTTSASATSTSTARRRRSPAARRSASGSRRRSARSSSASCTSSTSRRSGSTSATTTASSGRSTGSATSATRSSSSSTTSR